SRANIFHLMRILDSFLRGSRKIVFQTIAQHDLVDLMLPFVDHVPVPNCITNLLIASKPLEQTYTLHRGKARSVDIRKARFQKYLSQRNILMQVLKQVYDNRKPTEIEEAKCS